MSGVASRFGFAHSGARRVWWLSAAAVLAVLMPLLAVGIILAVVDPNDYKPQIAAAVSQAIGRALRLDGSVRIGWSVWPTIEASDVKLDNLAGGTRPDMARAELIKAQLSLPALLRRRLEVVKLTLVGPDILFELVQGRPNWEFNPDPTPKPALPSHPGTQASLRFRNVHVINGMVTSRMPARTKVLGIRSLDLQHLTDDGPLALLAVLVYSDNQPFTLRAAARPIAGDAQSWDTQLKFAAEDATASAEGTVNLAGGYDLHLDATVAALEKLNALLPQMQLPALHQVSLATHLTSGAVPGDLPVIGATKLHFSSADLGAHVPGLTLGAVDVALPAAGGLATISGVGSLIGQAFTLGGSFGVPEHPDGRATLPIELTFQARSADPGNKVPDGAQANLGVKGTVALHAGRFDGLDASVSLRAPALAGLRPVTSPVLAALTHISLNGRLVVPPDISALHLRDAKLSAHEADLAGDATIGLGQAVALNAILHATRLDLDSLSARWRTSEATSVQTPSDDSSRPTIPDTPLAWSLLRGPATSIKASVAAMTFQQQVWRNVELALELSAGRLRVNRLQMALPGGSPLLLSLTADASTDIVPVELALHGEGVPLASIARYADLPGPVTGVIRLDAQLRAAGRSLHDLAASLGGSVAATMEGGSMSNMTLRKLASSALEALSIEVPAQGETVINCLGLVGSFDKGVGRFRTIALDTTYLQVGGAGQIDLAAETVALKLHPLARISGASVSVPVLVEGPFRAVRGRLDASGFDKLGLLIDAWFGGDRPDRCVSAGFLSPGANGQ